MGWAKYYEDNVSICIGRMAMMESKSVYQRAKVDRQPKVIHKELQRPRMEQYPTITRCRQNGRRGLELKFQKYPELSVLRKLQMNGWWWSKRNVCWCNSDTRFNRTYVESYLKTYGPSISIVAYCD